ncbi:MFS transporter [Actinomadura sp. NAK00032]|uniref:MFS transporter n=1 Tax=Actinomadura sp. NAK00032 TaxID=2742128 RepID=UPI00158FB82A|nr:MFS transporter [Actinomadura sp. NAK00032]QKW36734.1 MFS transporter [Actinomadura sp. NAK00032]
MNDTETATAVLAAPATGRGAPTAAARGAVLAAAGLTLMAAAVIAPSLPAMAEAFGGTPAAESAVRLALTITSLAIAVSAPLAGALTDRFGRRGVLLGGLVLYALAGTAGALAPGLGVLIATRALLGVAVGGIITAVTATLTDWFDGDLRARYLGLQQAAASLGGVVLLPVAGLLSGLGWRAPFWLYGTGILVGAAVFATVRQTRPTPTRPAPGSGPSPTLQGRTTTARIAGIYGLALAATVVFYMAPTQVPFLLDGSGAGPTVVGLAIAASTLTGLFGALAYPVLWRHVPTSAITAFGIAALGTGWLLVATASLPGVFAGLLVGGLGVGVTVPNLNLVLSGLAPAVHRGRVLAGLVSGIFLGQFLSPIAVAPLAAATGVAGAFGWTGAAALTASLIAGTAALAAARSHRPA